jgi:hypothetical protein
MGTIAIETLIAAVGGKTALSTALLRLYLNRPGKGCIQTKIAVSRLNVSVYKPSTHALRVFQDLFSMHTDKYI